jgi:hypothetical protein
MAWSTSFGLLHICKTVVWIPGAEPLVGATQPVARREKTQRRAAIL